MKIVKLIFILLLLIFSSCAVQGPPSGGEIDNSSPEVIDIFPINNKKNLKNDEIIIIYFNQMINPTSAKMSFNVFPETDIIVSVKSNRIEIKPKIKWPINQFNIVGSRHISNYYGKKLSKILSLAYSTSDNLSLGEVSGTLFNFDSTKTYEIGLFQKSDLDDNLNLMYKTEQNVDGSFRFPNVKNENFILIALESKINNIIEDIKKHRYCISTINNMNSFNKSTNNHLYVYDNAEVLSLKSLDIINKYYGNIILNDGGSKPFISNDDFFDQTLFNDKKFIKLDYPENNDSILVTIRLDNNVETYYATKNLKLDNNINDAVGPRVDGNKLKNDSLYVTFTEPIKISNNNIFYTENDEKTFLDFIYINPMVLGIYNFNDSTKTIKINNEHITDMVNNTLLDTVMINDSSLDKSDIFIGGNIYGNIIYSGAKEIIVELFNEIDRYRFFNTNNNFHFSNVKPGLYNLWAYENINKKKSNYFNGTLEPLKNSAKFFIYKEDIEIRSKWDIEGIKIKID